ncbi:cyclase family protein [Schumannella luteola]
MNLADFESLLESIPAAAASPDALAGLRLATLGRVVSAGDRPASPSLDAGDAVAPSAPNPYRLSQWVESGTGWAATNDRLELDIHGAGSMTHVDAISHFDQDAPGDPLAELARTGIVGRGVLLDVPGVLGSDVSGRAITLREVEETLKRCGLELRPGDILHINLGRTSPARSDQPLGSVATAGLSIEAVPLVAAARPAAIVTDQGLDPMPSEVDEHPVPWHLVVLTALRIPLVDLATLTELSAVCAEVGRWEFLSVIAPLPIPSASGSPVNPLAIF